MSDFRSWLLKQKVRTDKVGEFATKAYNFKEWDGKQITLRKIVDSYNIPQFSRLYDKILEEYRNTPKPKRTTARGPYLLEHGSFSKVFQKKSDILEFYRTLKDSNLDVQLSKTDTDAVIALFKHHPLVDPMDDSIVTVKIDNSNSYCFHIDGEPHSYVPAYNSIGNDENQNMKKYLVRKLKQTARVLVSDQIPVCQPDEHMDHVRFFCHLVYDWFLELDLDLNTVKFVGSGSDAKFADEQLNISFREYHRENAILQPLAAKLNMAKQPARLDWSPLFK